MSGKTARAKRRANGTSKTLRAKRQARREKGYAYPTVDVEITPVSMDEFLAANPAPWDLPGGEGDWVANLLSQGNGGNPVQVGGNQPWTTSLPLDAVFSGDSLTEMAHSLGVEPVE